MDTSANTTLIGPVYEMQRSQTKTGKDILTMKMKVWRKNQDGSEKVCWFRIVTYAGSAAFLADKLKDGTVLVVEGVLDLYNDNGQEKFQVLMRKSHFFGQYNEEPIQYNAG
jgi:single-stranded DNA-binding protein